MNFLHYFNIGFEPSGLARLIIDGMYLIDLFSNFWRLAARQGPLIRCHVPQIAAVLAGGLLLSAAATFGQAAPELQGGSREVDQSARESGNLQDGSVPAGGNPAFSWQELGEKDGETTRSLKSNSLSIAELMEIDTWLQASRACESLRITSMEQPVPREIACFRLSDGDTVRFPLAPGRYRVTLEGPVPGEFNAIYETVDIQFTAVLIDEVLVITEFQDRSRRRKNEQSICIRLRDDDGPVEGASVTLYQRYRKVGEGSTGAKGVYCASGLRQGGLVINIKGPDLLPVLSQAELPAVRETLEFSTRRSHEYFCRVEDPGGLLKRKPNLKLWLDDYPETDELTGVPRNIFYFNSAREPKPQELHDIAGGRVVMKLFEDRVKAMAKAGRVALTLTDGEGFRLSYQMGLEQFTGRCVVRLPEAQPRRFHVRMSCPAGSYVHPGLPLFRWRKGEGADPFVDFSEWFPAIKDALSGADLLLEVTGPGPVTLSYGWSGCVSSSRDTGPLDDRLPVNIVNVHPDWCVSAENSRAENPRDEKADTGLKTIADADDREYCVRRFPLTHGEQQALLGIRDADPCALMNLGNATVYDVE